MIIQESFIKTILALSLVFNPLTVYAEGAGDLSSAQTEKNECISFLISNKSVISKNESTAIIPRAGTELAPPKPSELKVINTSLRKTSQGLFEQLVDSDLIYSPYFNMKAVSLGLSPKKLVMLSVNETQQAATEIYKKMRTDLTERNMNIEFLPNPNLSREIILKMPPEFVIDKIGENLIAAGIADKFILRDASFISESSNPSEHLAVNITAGVGSILLGFFGLLSTVDNSTWFYEYSRGDYILDHWTAGWAVGAVTLFASMFLSKSILKYLDKKNMKKYQQAAERAKDITPNNEKKDLFLYVSKETGTLKDSVEKISIQVDNAVESVGNTGTLITYGSSILNLHKELVSVFVNDFVHWMSIYDSQSLKIKENLKHIKDGTRSTVSDSQNTFVVLSKIFIEAAEGTRQTMDASNKIKNMLNEHLKVLNNVDQANFNSADHIDWSRKSKVLQTALLSQDQFGQNLEQVYQTISDILAGLDQIVVVESSATIRRMNDHLAVGQEIIETVDGLLESLEEMDKRLESLIPEPAFR